MKPIALALVLLLTTSHGAVHADEAMARTQHRDIVQVAQADPRFETLVAAVQAAGLVEALQGPGPFTVFAPTNAAFAALPEGTVASLLLPAQREALVRVLKFHVVRGKVLSSDLLNATSAGTLAGSALPIGLRVGDANVIQADIPCRNGVIHVIDAVLLPPPAVQTTPAMMQSRMNASHIVPTIEAAIDRGVPAFNKGDHATCARVYHEAAQALLDAGVLSVLDQADLSEAAHRAVKDPAERAWALREAFDRVILNDGFEPNMEASLPKGFPAPGPVGRIILKQYPQYRAARAQGGGSFWKLFSHIKSNDVQMTSPVEMTLSEGMQELDMAFLYEEPMQGRAGQQGAVAVLDLPAQQFLSIGVRGRRTDAMLKRAKALVETYMTSGGWKASGAWRVLGYNSPMVPAARQYWELQVPVAR